MFEIFTDMKSRAEIDQDSKLAASIDACIELWTKMLIADSAVNQTIAENFRDLQKENTDHLKQLQRLHGVLHAVHNQDIASREQVCALCWTDVVSMLLKWGVVSRTRKRAKT